VDEGEVVTEAEPPDDGGRPSKAVPILVGVVIGVLATAVAVLLIVVLTGDSSEDEPTATTTSTTTTSTTTTSMTPPTTIANGDLRGIALRLDVLLERSARARADVVEVISVVGPECGMEPGEASTRLFGVEESRQEILSQLSSLQVTGDEEADRLIALLLAAVQDSQHADQHYLNWVNAEYGRYYYENSVWDETTQTSTVNCPGEPPKTQDWDEAVAASVDATAAKQAFLAAYNPVAERYDLRAWSASEI
jgi:hypothetical protein